MRYYITNGSEYIGVGGEIVDTPKLAQRFIYGKAQSYLSKMKDGEKWEYRKYFTSGGRFVITTSTLYVTKGGHVTRGIEKAMPFKSPADAVNFIKNHRTVMEYIPSPVIVTSDHEFVSRPEIKAFTAEQLAVLGVKKATPRIKLPYALKAEVSQKTGDICPICGFPMADEEKTYDHIVPLSRGGKNTASNMRVVHKRCNEFKSNYLDKEMYSMVSNIEAKRIWENPRCNEALFMTRVLLRGILNNLKEEYHWENTD